MSPIRPTILFSCLLFSAAFAAHGAETTNLTAPVSVNDSVRTWLHDHVERPVAPFQLVPGKPASDWAFAIEPYGWAPAFSPTISVPNFPSLSLSADPAQVISKLNWAIMLRGEVRKGRFGVLADGMFAQFSASADPNGPLYSSASAKLQFSIDSLAFSFRIIDDRRGYLDVYAGARYYYLGLDLSAQTDSAGIQQLANTRVDRIDQNLAQRASAFVRSHEGISAAALAEALRSGISGQDLAQMADIPRKERDLMSSRKWSEAFDPDSHAMRDYLRALAVQKVAQAAGVATPQTAANVESARQKLVGQIAKGIESRLPRQVTQNAWWIDPIVGFRAQINFTHWLYLNTQADVGGFGAGSQLAWFLQGALGVNISRSVALELGYRYVYFDYTSGATTMTTSMPGAFGGVVFRF